MTETFHEYPPPKFGGTLLVIRGETIRPEEWLIDRMKSKEQKAKEREQLKKLKEKEKEKRKKEAEKRKQDKLKKKEKGIIEYEMKVSKTLRKKIDNLFINWPHVFLIYICFSLD